MTKALQGLFGCSSPGTRACCGCFDLLARAVCATRLVTVEAVSGFPEVSSTPTKPTKVKDLLLFWHSLTKRACWTFKVGFFHASWHTHMNKWKVLTQPSCTFSVPSSFSLWTNSLLPVKMMTGVMKRWLPKTKFATSALYELRLNASVIVHSLSKNSFIEAKGRRTQDATRDEKGTKWKIVNVMECFRFFLWHLGSILQIMCHWWPRSSQHSYVSLLPALVTTKPCNFENICTVM